LVEKVQNIVDSLLVRLVVGLTLTCCCIFSFTQDIRFLSSVKSSNAEVLVRVVNSFPRDTFRSNYAAEILVSSKYLRSSRIVILESLRNNPRNLQGWKMLLQNQMATQSEKKLALKRISELTND
jgi:hypothetical protein